MKLSEDTPVACCNLCENYKSILPNMNQRQLFNIFLVNPDEIDQVI